MSIKAKEFLKNDLASEKQDTSEVSIAIKNFLTSDYKSIYLVSKTFDLEKLTNLKKVIEKTDLVIELESEKINISSVYNSLIANLSKEVYEKMKKQKLIRSAKINSYHKSLVSIDKL